MQNHATWPFHFTSGSGFAADTGAAEAPPPAEDGDAGAAACMTAAASERVVALGIYFLRSHVALNEYKAGICDGG